MKKKHYKLSNMKNNKMDYENRIILYNALHKKLKDNQDCSDDLSLILINQGGFSTNWKKEIILNNNVFSYALKIQKVKSFIIKDAYNKKYNVWREYDILTKCTNLVLNKVSCNLPILYDLQICERDNKVIFYNELANGSFIDWIYIDHTVEEWESFLFQLWLALYTLQKHLKLIHNDLRYGNVLYHEVSNVIHKYKIDDDEYYVPTCGYTFVIWDYGGSKLVNCECADVINQTKLDYSSDLHFFHDSYNRLRVLMLLNKYTGPELESFFMSDGEMEYMKDTRCDCEIKFRKSGRYDEKYKISLAYYLIEHGRFNELYDKKKENLSEKKVVRMPPLYIMEILKELSDNNYDYDDIIQFNVDMPKKIPSIKYLIEKYFSKYKAKKNYKLEFIV